MPRTLERALSFGSLEEEKFTFIGRTEASDHEIPEDREKPKISETKKEFEMRNFN